MWKMQPNCGKWLEPRAVPRCGPRSLRERVRVRANHHGPSALGTILLLIFACSSAAAADAPTTSAKKKVVIPFDFVSKFDQGRYGARVGDLIWTKLKREGGFVIPESMLDVREYCASHQLRPSPQIDLGQMKKIVCDDFGGQIGIWGSVERAPGAAGERYDLVLKCVDFSTDPPTVIHQATARTNSVSEIPHLYVKQMLDALYRRSPSSPHGPDRLAEENWRKNANLIDGGDFESGSGGVPKGWESVAGQQRERLGRQVRWVAESAHSQNHLIRFTLDREVAENEGLMYYSRLFPIEEGAKYRFQCRWRSTAPAVKVFIKCYDEIDTPYRGSRAKQTSASRYSSREGGPSCDDRLREVYRSQQNLSGPMRTWNTHTEDFTPKHTKYSPQWGRVMLYAYVKAGVVDFDDVVVKQIVPPPSLGRHAKVRRNSSETQVTTEEMEANEHRSQEPKQ